MTEEGATELALWGSRVRRQNQDFQDLRIISIGTVLDWRFPDPAKSQEPVNPAADALPVANWAHIRLGGFLPTQSGWASIAASEPCAATWIPAFPGMTKCRRRD